MMYEIEVFGLDLEDVDSVGGWQLYYRGNIRESAERTLRMLLMEHGWDNVSWNWVSDVADEFFPDEYEEGFDYEVGFDPYMGCYSYDC